jgi:hypothetical protein
LFAAGGNKELALFQQSNGNFKILIKINTDFEIIGLEWNPSPPSDSLELWAGTRTQGAVKFRFGKSWQSSVTNYYGQGDGLPADWIIPYQWTASGKKELIFGTSAGLLRFVNEESIKVTLPESLQSNPANYRGYFEPAGVTDSPVLCMSEASDMKKWLTIDNEITCFDSSGKRKELYDYPGINYGKINCLFTENSTLWIGADDGLVRYEIPSAPAKAGIFHCTISRVMSTGKKDTLLFTGNFTS